MLKDTLKVSAFWIFTLTLMTNHLHCKGLQKPLGKSHFRIWCLFLSAVFLFAQFANCGFTFLLILLLLTIWLCKLDLPDHFFSVFDDGHSGVFSKFLMAKPNKTIHDCEYNRINILHISWLDELWCDCDVDSLFVKIVVDTASMSKDFL